MPWRSLKTQSLGVVRGLEALGQLGNDLAVRRNFGEVVQDRAEHADLGVVGDEGGRIQHVGRRRVGHAEAQGAALLGLGGP